MDQDGIRKPRLSRREFLAGTVALVSGGGVAAVLAWIVAYFFPRNPRDLPAEPVRAGSLDELTARGYIDLTYGVYPVTVLPGNDKNNGNVGPVAYSRVCTHFSCTVHYDAADKLFRCPCHDGVFDAGDGAVLGGPPVEPLRRFPVFVRAGDVYLGEADD